MQKEAQGSYLFDDLKGEIYFSSDWKKLLKIEGMTPLEAVSFLTRRVHPEDRPGVQKELLRVYECRASLIKLEFRAKIKDSDYIWMFCQGNISYNKQGMVDKFYGTYMDITRYKKAEQLLQQRETRQAFLVSLVDLLHSYTNPVDIQKKAAQMIGEYLKADRAFCSDIIYDKRLAVIGSDYFTTGLKSLSGSYVFYDFLERLPFLLKGKPFFVNDIHESEFFPEHLISFYESLDICSLIAFPFLRNGLPAWLLVLASSTPRIWVEEEITLIKEVSERTREAINSARIKESLNFQARLLSQVHEAVIGLNRENNIIFWNKGAEAIFGWSPEEATGMNAFELFQNRDLMDKLLLTQEVECEAVHKHRNGSYIVCELNSTALKDAEGGIIGIVAALRDVTIRKRAEDELRRSEEKYRNLFNSIDNGFCIIEMMFDTKGKPFDYRFMEMNPAFKKQIGCDFMEGKLISSSKSDEDKNLLEILGRVALSGKPQQYLYRAKKSNRWFSLYIFKINKGSFNNVAVLYKDITKIVRERNELEESLKAQDEIFANISHELKTPLNVIFSTNRIMETYLRADLNDANKSKLIKYNQIIKQNCYRFTKLINNIVDLSKIKSGFYKLLLMNVNIVTIIEGIVKSVEDYCRDKKLEISFDTNVTEKIMACDIEKIERIVINLISNAVKFSDPGGKINVRFLDKGNYVEITVSDTGIGIDKKHLNMIFKRYYQVDKSLDRNSEGSGIGLSLVKSIVELLGGKITVESEVNEGSVFKVELPVRLVQQTSIISQVPAANKVEIINVEFSDIYK